MEPELTATQRRLFAGTNFHTLDAKNRVTIPARWRLEGEAEFYAVPGVETPTIALLLASELEKIISKVNSIPNLSETEAKAFLRRFCAAATPCPLDKQGRVVLPADQCARAKLAGDVVLIGTGSTIEVWDQEAWQAESEASAPAFDEIRRKIAL